MKRFLLILLFPVLVFGGQTINTPTTFLNSAPITINTGGAFTIQSGVTVQFSGNRLLGTGTPINASDAANKLYVDSAISGGGVAWGGITGTLSDQADLQAALDSKQNTLTIGNLTDAGTDGLTITGGTGSVIGSGTSLSQHVADATHNGYLSSADWSTFNSGGVAPAALTKTDDTNVTLTLGGTPSTALLQATSLTLGWTGTLATGRGGTGVGTLGDITKTDDTNVTLTLGGTPTGAVITSTSFTLGWTGTLAVSRGGTGAATASAHTFLGNNTGSTAAPSFSSVKDDDLSLSDITTNNVSTSKHGFAPKSPNDVTKFLDGTGAYSVPPGTGASTSAHYVTTQAEAGLSNEFSLGSLTTGMLKHSVSASVSTPATAVAETDYWDTADFIASGGSHAHGLVPDPGSSSGTTKFLREDSTWAVPPGAGGTGTVTSFSSGNLSPLFTTSVANSTTTPALSFSLSTAAAHTYLGNNTGSTAVPAYNQIAESELSFTDITTGNVSTTKHGYATKGDGDSTHYLDGTGAYTAVNVGVTAPLTLTLTNGTTNAIDNILTIDHESTGTPVVNFGAGFDFKLKSSTTANRDAAQISAVWSTATDASRVSYMDFKVANGGATVSQMQLSGAGGLTVGSVDLQAAGIINANVGFKTGNNIPAQGRILMSDGVKFSLYGPVYPFSVGATNTVVQSNGSTAYVAQFLKGTTTNDNAGAGDVGEEVESLKDNAHTTSLTTATAANITSISLTHGDWDVVGIVNFTETTSTVTARSAGIGTTSATLPTDGSEGYCGVQSTLTSETNSITLSRKRISISSTTTVYLVGSATFSAGTCAGFGAITARRVR